MTANTLLTSREAIKTMLCTLAASSGNSGSLRDRSALVASTLEHLHQHTPLPPRPPRRPPACEQDVLALDQHVDYGAVLNKAVLFLQGALDEEEPDFGYDWEEAAIEFTSPAEATAAITATLAMDAGCYEALNLFKWSGLVKILKAEGSEASMGLEERNVCLKNLLKAAIKADAYEQAFELAGLVLGAATTVQSSGGHEEQDGMKELAQIMCKLARWVNFVRRGVLEEFLRVFSSAVGGEGVVGQRLMKVDKDGRWARHWLAQTRVRCVLGEQMVKELVKLVIQV